jgi:pilus assembly protein Flp/PilA
MKAFAVGIKRFLKDEEGVTMVEYGLIAALIAVVCVVAIITIGNELNVVFETIGNCLEAPSATTCAKP